MTDSRHFVVDHDDNQYVLYDHGKAVGSAKTADEIITISKDLSDERVWTEKAQLAHAHELMQNPTPPTEIFLCAWTGGLEVPQYALSATKEHAIARVAEAWLPDFRPDEGDSIDILRLDLLSLQIEDLKLSPVEIALMADELLEGPDER